MAIFEYFHSICAFPAAPLFVQPVFRRGKASLPAAEKENISEISPGKAEPFRRARGEAPRSPG
jgi:hypothetical protein